MAGTKFSGLDPLGEFPDAADIIPILDVDDTTQSPEGSTKGVAVGDLITGEANWGSINGTLSDQGDVQAAIDAKVSSVVAGTGITVDDTDPQNPIVTASGGGGGEIPRGSITLTDYNNPWEGTGSPPLYGIAKVESSGTGASAAYGFRGIGLTSGTTGSSYGRAYVYFQNAGSSWWHDEFWNLKPRFQGQFSVNLSTASTGYMFFGMSDEIGAAPAASWKHAGIWASMNGTAITWYATHSNATTQVTTDITATVTAMAGYAVTDIDRIYDVLVVYNGTSITFYFNGTLVATHTTNLPSGAAGAVGRYICTGVIKNTAGTTSNQLSIYSARSTYQLYT